MNPCRLSWAGICIALVALAGGNAHGQEYRDVVVIVLDGSGSMGELMGKGGQRQQKMAAASEALKTVLLQIPDSTHVGLLAFGQRASDGNWAYEIGPRDDARMTAAIDSIRPGGGTPLGHYMKLAADRLMKERAKQFGYGSYRMLVVTDGEANDAALVERYTPEIMGRGVTVDVIGVAMAKAHTLANKVHSYRGADDPAALTQALSEVFAEVSSSSSGGGAVDFELLEGLPFEVAAAMVSTLGMPSNDPIGERTRQAAAPRSLSGSNPRNSVPTPPRDAADSDDSGFPRLWGAIFVIVILMLVVRKKRRH
jgi:uncharacterized protein YegL